jgi:hypothetical protein
MATLWKHKSGDVISADIRTKNLPRTELAAWVRLCVIAALIAFAVLTVIGIVRTFTSVPRADDWDGNLEFFANVSEGHWQAWFAQFTEHRIILPRLFYWADIRFFGGRFLFQLISGVAFAIALWAMFLVVAGALIKDRSMRFLIGAMITLLLSSWMQIPNFGIAFNGIQWFMVTFFVLATFVATARAKDNQLAFYLAAFCGIAAAATLTNGLIALPLAAVLAYLVGLGTVRATALLLLAATVFAAYFTGYVRPEIDGSPLAALADPIGIAQYVLAYLGDVAFYVVFIAFAGVDLTLKILAGEQSVGLDKFSDHPVAFAAGLTAAKIAGAALISLTASLGWRWLKSNRDPLRGALIIFVLFVCGTAFATALGRLSAFGLEQSIAARYTTTTIAGLAALAILTASYLTARQVTVLFLSSVVFLLPRQLTALRSREAEHARFEKAMQAVIEHRDTEEDRAILYPQEPETVDRVANRLRAMQPQWKWDSNWYGMHSREGDQKF